MDAETLLPVLKVSYERGRRKGFLVDVGANHGDTVAAMLATFGQRLFASVDGSNCQDVNGPPVLYAFEPNPKAFKVLTQRFPSGSAGSHRLHLVEAALNLLPGNKTFYYKGGSDTLGAFVVWRNKTDVQSAKVKVFSLDSFFGPYARMYLLKIDAEGYDPAVLLGASRILRERRVKFLVFEYSWSWRDQGARGSSLEFIAGWLWERGYMCFLLTAAALVPISGPWWQDRYESHTWTNCFCGRSADPDLFDAYVAFGTNRHTLSFALENLAAWKEPLRLESF